MPILAIDVVALFVALAVLLMLLAGWVFFRAIEGVLRKVPLIGGSIANTVSSGLASVMKATFSALDYLTVGVAHLFWAIGVTLWNFVYGAVQGILDAKQWAVDAFQHASSLFTQLRAELGFDIGVVEGDIAKSLNAAESYASGLLSGIDGQIATIESDVQSEAARVLGQAEAFAAAQASAVQSEAVTLFGQAEAAAQAGADAVLSEAVTLFGQAEAGIAALGQDIAVLPGQIEGVIPGIVEGVVPGLIAGAIPGILAQVLPRVTTLEAEATRCLEPLCDTVTPNAKQLGNLGNLFKNLELLGIEALIVALAAECLTDPGAVVHDISTVVNDVGGGAMAGFRDLVGA